jgi:HEAT repeats
LPIRENKELTSVLARLFSTEEAFARVIQVLRTRKPRALPALVPLLKHRDPGWRRVAAVALGRVQQTPRSALPGLLNLLSSPDASAQVAALSAIEWLPPRIPIGQSLPSPTCSPLDESQVRRSRTAGLMSPGGPLHIFSACTAARAAWRRYGRQLGVGMIQ